MRNGFDTIFRQMRCAGTRKLHNSILTWINFFMYICEVQVPANAFGSACDPGSFKNNGTNLFSIGSSQRRTRSAGNEDGSAAYLEEAYEQSAFNFRPESYDSVLYLVFVSNSGSSQFH